MQDTIIKTVKRGHIMRFNHEEFWDEVLYPIPKGAQLFDSDANLYYVDEGDGTPLREFYGHFAPYDRDLYQPDEPYEDTVEYVEEYRKEQKRQMLANQAEEDKQKTKESMLRQLQASMMKIHRR